MKRWISVILLLSLLLSPLLYIGVSALGGNTGTPEIYVDVEAAYSNVEDNYLSSEHTEEDRSEVTVESLNDADNAKSADEIDNQVDSNGADNIDGAGNADDAEYPDGTGDIDDVEDTEDTKDTEDTADTSETDNADDADNTDDADDTDNTDDVEISEEEEEEEDEEDEEDEEEELNNNEYPKIYINVDDDRTVTVVTSPDVSYEVMNEDGEGDIIVMFQPDNSEIEINEEDISVHVPLEWTYEVDLYNNIVTITPPERNEHIATVYVEIDLDGNININTGIEHRIEWIGDFINISLLATLDENEIRLSLPEGWSYQVSHSTEIPVQFAEYIEWMRMENLASGMEHSVFTIITVTHPLNSLFRESGYSNIMPLSLPGNTTLTYHNILVTTQGQLTTALNNAPQNAAPNSFFVIRVNSTITLTSGIAVSRQNSNIILTTNGTNLTAGDNPNFGVHASGTRHEIRQNNAANHFTVSNGARLTLVNIIIDGRNAAGTHPQTAGRGGIVLENSGYLIMRQGSIIQNNRPINAGGGVRVTTNSTFTMYDGIIRNNIGFNNGGGVTVGNLPEISGQTGHDGQFYMYGGEIIGNIAATGHSGGVQVVGSGITHLYGGLISGNRAVQFGGGVGVGGGVREEGTHVLATIGGDIRIENNYALIAGGLHVRDKCELHMSGGYIQNNSLTQNGDLISTGGGVIVTDVDTRFIMTGGTIRDNHAIQGGGVYMINRATFEMSAEASIHNNTALNGGGGVNITDADTKFIMTGGTISDNSAIQGGGVSIGSGATFEISAEASIRNNTALNGGGGGLVVDQGGLFTMNGGEVINNTADDGGGLFTNQSNLGNINISTAATFLGNEALNGLRINTVLAERHRPHINPSTVSNPGVSMIGESPYNSGDFAVITPHLFTNHDINSSSSPFWRVTYEVGEGAGEVIATVGTNNFPVPNGSFVQGDVEVNFSAISTQPFAWWNVGTRTSEVDEGGNDVEFSFSDGGEFTPLRQPIEAHTHVVGNFVLEHMLTYDPNGGLGDVLIKWVLPGIHIVDHEVTHENINGIPIKLLGWNTEPDGSGTFYEIGSEIDILDHTILYAQWDLATTTLTVSKKVIGQFSHNQSAFEFTVIFRDSDERLLPQGAWLDYRGDIIASSGAIAPADGRLVLDENGRATFSLRHGQVIIIEGVPLSAYIQIIETPNSNYKASFIDSLNEGAAIERNDTTILSMTVDRSFYFTNERYVPPATGINPGYSGVVMLLSALVVPLAFAGLKIKSNHRRRNMVFDNLLRKG